MASRSVSSSCSSHSSGPRWAPCPYRRASNPHAWSLPHPIAAWMYRWRLSRYVSRGTSISLATLGSTYWSVMLRRTMSRRLRFRAIDPPVIDPEATDSCRGVNCWGRRYNAGQPMSCGSARPAVPDFRRDARFSSALARVPPLWWRPCDDGRRRRAPRRHCPRTDAGAGEVQRDLRRPQPLPTARPLGAHGDPRRDAQPAGNGKDPTQRMRRRLRHDGRQGQPADPSWRSQGHRLERERPAPRNAGEGRRSHQEAAAHGRRSRRPGVGCPNQRDINETAPKTRNARRP